MTNISTVQSDFDFWEFVSCAKCQLPFSVDAGVVVPFWLTECGHVICNNHLNPDQSCSQCGSQGIRLAPLQREMEAPMSEWFRSVPVSLDSIAFTAKFQQETMASQIRYYKTRHQQLRHFAERLKRDVADLKKANGVLQSEIDQLRLQMDHRHAGQVSSDTPNSNGKRQMSTNHYDYRRPTTNSSPHPTPIPLGPNRLTLARGQQLPELFSREQHNPGLHRSHAYEQENFANTVPQRPISSRSLEQYVYIPPDTPKFQSHQGRYQGLSAMPPAKSRFTPAPGSKAQFSTTKGTVGQAFPRQTNMDPPPTPQRFRAQRSNTSNRTDNDKSINHLLPPPSRRLGQKSQNADITIPDTLHQQSSDAASQRFFQTCSTSNPRGSSSQPSAVPNMRGEHKMPFVPEAAVSQQGFG